MKNEMSGILERHKYRICGSHSGGYEEFYLVGYSSVQSVESQSSFRG
jgi:hypothetical protein